MPASRAVLLARRLVQVGRAPAGLGRLHGRGGPSAPSTRIPVRSMAKAALQPAAPCYNCEKEILQLRKEVFAEIQQTMRLYDGLMEVNQQILMKVCEMQADFIKRHVETVEAMHKTSYSMLASGAAFMLAMFTTLSPLIKSAWQQDMLDVMEEKMVKMVRLEIATGEGKKVDTEGTDPAAPTAGSRNEANESLSDKVAEMVKVDVVSDEGTVNTGVKGANESVSAKVPEVEGTGPGKVPAGLKTGKK